VQWEKVFCFPKTLGICLAPRNYSLRGGTQMER
jgi:hypothetical protein